MEEQFLDYPINPDLFAVSSLGRVLSKRSGRILKTHPSNGYDCFATKIGGRCGQNVLFRVHRLVAETFVPNLFNKPFVNHIDGNKKNNNFKNLEWVTAKENSIHARDSGLLNLKIGFESPHAKLTREDVDYIRDYFVPRDKVFGARALGRKFGVAHSTIMSHIEQY